MPRLASLLALVLLALCGAASAAHAATLSVDRDVAVPVEAPASPDVPSEAEESGAEEDALPVMWGVHRADAVTARPMGQNETSSANLTVQTPPPER